FSTRPARTARIVEALRRTVAEATARRRTSGFPPISTIFAMADGQRSCVISSCALCQGNRGNAESDRRRATRARKRRCQVVASDTRRVIYDARAFRELRAERDARTKGWEGRPLRGLLLNDPLDAASRPARHDTRRRQGEA